MADQQQPRLGAFPYVIGGFSFIPLIGVLFGIVAIIWGLKTRRGGGKKLALLGVGGIAFTVALYSALFYFGFVQRGGTYDELRSKLSQSNIDSLVQAVEFYKAENGRYPESLEVLRKSLSSNSTVSVYDPSDVNPGSQQKYYYYELVDSDHYYLLGLGPDGQPFTKDDIVPNIKVSPGSKVGLLIKSPGETGP